MKTTWGVGTNWFQSGKLPANKTICLSQKQNKLIIGVIKQKVSHFIHQHIVFNRPGVAGAVLQSPPSLIKTLIKSWFVEIYSKYCYSQTIRARELKF